MSKGIIFIYIIIIISKIIITSVVRRININYVNFTLMCISQGGEGFQIISLNQNMVRGIFIFTDYGTFLYLC